MPKLFDRLEASWKLISSIKFLNYNCVSEKRYWWGKFSGQCYFLIIDAFHNLFKLKLNLRDFLEKFTVHYENILSRKLLAVNAINHEYYTVKRSLRLHLIYFHAYRCFFFLLRMIVDVQYLRSIHLDHYMQAIEI